IVMALRKKIPVKWLPILLAILLIVDLWGVNRRFMRPQPQTTATSYFRATADVQYLKKQEGQFRIFPVEDQRSPNWYVYHGIQSAHGYQGAKLRLYQELIDAFKMPNGFIQKYVKIQEGRPVLRDTSEVDARLVNFHGTFLKLMNVRYIISPYPLPDTTLKIVFPPRVRGGNAVFEFKGALPRVFFPGLVMTMNGKDNILNYMTSSGFDPAVTAVIEEDAPFQIAHSDSNQAKITEYDLHRIVIDADVKAPSLLVVSEMYYPAGWKVFVDGIEEKIIKTNHAFRSVFLQPGTHEIVFSFKPKIFRLGLLISSITFLLLIAGTFLGWRMERKKPSVQEMTETGN
ncbi:YfhO family protein, partial [bacterium]